MTKSGYHLEKSGTIRFWELDCFKTLGCRGVFFQRPGGMSRGFYQGLNLGFNTQDHFQHVWQNRALAFQASQLGPLLPVMAQQIHGSHLQIVNHYQAGKGWASLASALPGQDGLITCTPGLPLAITIADCLPILLADEDGKAVAAVHAGWKGIVSKILPHAIKSFHQNFKIAPERIWAALGPGIGPDHFLVQGQVRQLFDQQYPEAVVKKLPGNRARIDLWKAAKSQLQHCGVVPNRIIVIRECTACHPHKYYSYRRDQGHTGRMLACVQIML